MASFSRKDLSSQCSQVERKLTVEKTMKKSSGLGRCLIEKRTPIRITLHRI
jgi:hypothetical protein